MNLKKQELKMMFMSAVNMIIAGALANKEMDLDDVITCLIQMKSDYIQEIKKAEKEIK